MRSAGRRSSPAPPSPEKKNDSRITAPKSAIEAAARISCPKLRLELADVLEHRDDHAQRGGAQDDRHEQRRLDEVDHLEQQRHRQGDRERERPADQRQAEQAAAQSPEVDLETGQEEQDREPLSKPAPRSSRRPRPTPGSTARSMIPATISKTTEGRRTRGNRPSTNGAAKATAITINSPLNPGSLHDGYVSGRPPVVTGPRRSLNALRQRVARGGVGRWLRARPAGTRSAGACPRGSRRSRRTRRGGPRSGARSASGSAPSR